MLSISLQSSKSVSQKRKAVKRGFWFYEDDDAETRDADVRSVVKKLKLTPEAREGESSGSGVNAREEAGDDTDMEVEAANAKNVS